MIPDPRRPEEFTTPEQLFEEVARMARESKQGRSRPRLGRKTMLAGVLLGLTGLSVAGAMVASTCTLCYAVTAGGQPLAYVRGQETYIQAVRQVEEQVSAILRTDYAYPEKAKVSLTIAPKEKVQTREELTDSLMGTVEQVKKEYVLTVDGTPVAACDDRSEIAKAIRQAKETYTSEDTVEVTVSSEVDVSKDYLPAQAEVLDAEELAQRLTQPAGAEGETWMDEAGTEALAAFIPEEYLVEAAEADSQPLLNVRTVEEVTYTQPIPSPVEEREDSSLLVGERKTLQEGAPGEEEVTDRVTLRCGVEQSRETLSAVTLTEPTATVVAVGTGQGAEGAKGRFLWPCMGQVSSTFGSRHIFGSSGFHTGTDIAAAQGADINASAAGTVVWAGAKGTYGNLVKVDHGNGYETYYAHCSKILVQVGDWVSQGQTIAKVGSTGRATGPHCHFEIRWQGEAFDAQSCLP